MPITLRGWFMMNSKRHMIMDNRIIKIMPLLLCILSVIYACCNKENENSVNDIYSTVLWKSSDPDMAPPTIMKKKATWLDYSPFIDSTMVYHKLTEDEFNEVRTITKTAFLELINDSTVTDSIKPYDFNMYYEQYIGYKLNGVLYTYGNFYTHISAIYGHLWGQRIDPEEIIVNRKDIKTRIDNRKGGKNYAHILINMNTKKVVELQINEGLPSNVE